MITTGLILGDITVPSPYFCTVLSATFTQHQQDFQNIQKDVGILPHSILMVPCRILRTVLGPLDLYKPYGFIPEMFSLPVQYAH